MPRKKTKSKKNVASRTEDETQKLRLFWPSAAVVTAVSVFLVLRVCRRWMQRPVIVTTDMHFSKVPRRFPQGCSSHYIESGVRVDGCSRSEGGSCDRIIIDDFLSTDSISTLISMSERGMGKAKRSKKRAGPFIMDVNSGFVLASGSSQPDEIYRDGQIFTSSEYDMYRRVTSRIKTAVEEAFGLSRLYFTAPTFITREIGETNWQPRTMHDEYWHVHVDKNNTEHYDYSGLVYLSDYGKDFEGGELHFYPDSSLDCSAFVDPVNPGPCSVTGDADLIVHPKKGRLIVFPSGRENPHRVTQVTSGTRYVLSFWFTCDSQRKFSQFLNGKAHRTFSN